MKAKTLICALALVSAAAVARAEITIYPEIANNRGPMAHCFEAGVCYISGHLSNGQHCWVEETDEKGNVIHSYWGDSWKGSELLEKHLAEKCDTKKAPIPQPTPCPTPTPTMTPTPEPTPEPYPTPTPTPTKTPRPKPRPKQDPIDPKRP